ncbi:hypothetical protein SAMN02745134_00560 [Clostridium acidisoli DSM 12555]|uniref:Uncharacterized protein n=1 Tax=Clostridium acidisoli DSM 12555 TaxID=1121291 RepID=A0A1W1X3N1_9CLOT|nr:hypothetical protein [Clostridium acidisoli]SMC18430.1 hypothetical protein SAMN02745134_00560 [Clostridium acidisoli DSM 12555]
MELLPFNRPTKYYDERVKQIDEKICELIKQRKEISNNNPGYPPFEYVSQWAEKFDLYEEQLKFVFKSLWNEKAYRPFVNPNGFRMNLPVLKIVEKDNSLFSVIFIRQYSNSSVINFNIDLNETRDTSNFQLIRNNFKLSIGEEYDCRMTSGSGGKDHYSYNFVVSPPLPDNFSGIDLRFKEYKIIIGEGEKSTGNEVVIHL